MIGGALVGAGVAIAITTGIPIALPWVVSMGLAKLGLVTSGGLMAVGAGLRRHALRKEDRARLASVGRETRY